MAVTLDAPSVPVPDGEFPSWRVQCEHGATYDRLFLVAPDAEKAAKRAVVEYGWVGDEERIWCREHSRG